MVTRIDGEAAPKPTAQRNQNLRSNFKSLSSGSAADLRVAQAAEVSVSARKDGSGEKLNVDGLMKNLNDAMMFSSQALEAIEGIEEEVSKSEKPTETVREFADDLERLKKDISTTLNLLKGRAVTADVIQENMRSAESKIEDIKSALEQAQSTGVEMQFSAADAIDAHSGLEPERVAKLLAE